MVELDNQMANNDTAPSEHAEHDAATTRLRFEINPASIQPCVFPCFEEDSAAERTEMHTSHGVEIGFQVLVPVSPCMHLPTLTDLPRRLGPGFHLFSVESATNERCHGLRSYGAPRSRFLRSPPGE